MIGHVSSRYALSAYTPLLIEKALTNHCGKFVRAALRIERLPALGIFDSILDAAD